MLVKKLNMFGIRKGEELKTPRHTSAAASYNNRLPYSQQREMAYLLSWLTTIKAIL